MESMCDRQIELFDFGFSIRTNHMLLRNGIITLDKLLSYSREDLLKIRNLGRRAALEIEGKLAEKGYSLKPSEHNPESQA